MTESTALTSTTAVLLAAGAGTRLGLGAKALLPFRGTTLMAHLAGELLRAGCTEVVVVIGAGAAQVRAAPLPPGCRIVENPRWEEGMGSSFSAGVAAGLSAAGDAAVAGPVLVALVDQPGVTWELVSTLLALHRPGRITAAGYHPPGGTGATGTLRRGHPVLFPRQHALRAAALAHGDSGARAYLAAHAELVDVIDCSPFSDGADIDIPADLHLLD